MREILFRGKRLDNGEWIYGDLLQSDNPFRKYIRPENTASMVQVDCKSIGQYTGLCDKNGQKIFEGDILRTNNSNCEIWTVGYVRGAFSAEQTNANYKCVLGIFMMASQVEVIGNIHDNPDLLKGE